MQCSSTPPCHGCHDCVWTDSRRSVTSCRWPHSLGSDLLPALRPRAGVTAETPCLQGVRGPSPSPSCPPGFSTYVAGVPSAVLPGSRFPSEAHLGLLAPRAPPDPWPCSPPPLRPPRTTSPHPLARPSPGKWLSDLSSQFSGSVRSPTEGWLGGGFGPRPPLPGFVR